MYERFDPAKGREFEVEELPDPEPGSEEVGELFDPSWEEIRVEDD